MIYSVKKHSESEVCRTGNRNIKQVILPLITAFIWGSAIVAQSISTNYIGTFTFNAARSLVGALSLLLFIIIRGRFKKRDTHTDNGIDPGSLIPGGICCGIFLALAVVLQNQGLRYTGAGKAAFITAMYVVLVPVAGLFFRRKVAPLLWVSMLVAVAGLYFLCMDPAEGLGFNKGDLLVLMSSFAFTAQILAIDHFVKRSDSICLSCIQFGTVFLLCSAGALLFEDPSVSQLQQSLPYILYVGIFSSAVAYTLQIVAQKDGNPVIVSLILSLESFFAVLVSAAVLHERLSFREVAGCVLMMAAVVLSQLKTGQPQD